MLSWLRDLDTRCLLVALLDVLYSHGFAYHHLFSQITLVPFYTRWLRVICFLSRVFFSKVKAKERVDFPTSWEKVLRFRGTAWNKCRGKIFLPGSFSFCFCSRNLRSKRKNKNDWFSWWSWISSGCQQKSAFVLNQRIKELFFFDRTKKGQDLSKCKFSQLVLGLTRDQAQQKYQEGFG